MLVSLQQSINMENEDNSYILGKEWLNRVLCVNPDKRFTIEEALDHEVCLGMFSLFSLSI